VARARARTAVAPRPQLTLRLGRYLPSPRSLAVGFGLVALAGGLYGVARETSAFAVDSISVAGAPPRAQGQVRRSLATLRGTSLLALDGAALERRLEALPTVVSAEYDRSFPHTLRVVVVPERPVAVLRQGSKAWLISARGRATAAVSSRAAQQLPRVWIPRTTRVVVGGFLPAAHAGAVARALALAGGLPAHVVQAQVRRDGLVFRLRSGLELRLGDPTDIRLKLAIAGRAFRVLPPGSTYLDVSVPGRPVAGDNPQVSGRA
jgi:cell division protein FtsQ